MRVEVTAELEEIATARAEIDVRVGDVAAAAETLRVESEHYLAGRSTLDDVLEYEAVLRQRTTLGEACPA